MATISEAVYFCAHFAQSSVKGGQEYDEQNGKKGFRTGDRSGYPHGQKRGPATGAAEALHWRDVAKAITLLADAERERLFRQMDAQTLAEIFPYLDDASRYLAELPAELAAAVITDMDTADALDMLRWTAAAAGLF